MDDDASDGNDRSDDKDGFDREPRFGQDGLSDVDLPLLNLNRKFDCIAARLKIVNRPRRFRGASPSGTKLEFARR